MWSGVWSKIAPILSPGLQLFRDRKGCGPTSSLSDKDYLEQMRQEVVSKYELGAELIPVDYHRQVGGREWGREGGREGGGEESQP